MSQEKNTSKIFSKPGELGTEFALSLSLSGINV
jgi:hypothetical protein